MSRPADSGAPTGPAHRGGPRAGVLVALFGVGVAAFNAPLVRIWDSGATVFGLPLLPVALFAVWAALIVALALASEGLPRRRSPPTGSAPLPGEDGDGP